MYTVTTTTPTPVDTPPPAFVACEGRQEDGVSLNWEEVGERLMMVYNTYQNSLFEYKEVESQIMCNILRARAETGWNSLGSWLGR